MQRSIEERKAYFRQHEITVLHKSKEVSRFKFADPKTWNLGFYLTCADNLIVMNGDCWSLLLEPGYGRDGLAFLRGSVRSVGYLLEKCPFHNPSTITEFSHSYAMELIQGYVKDGYITEGDIEEAVGLDEQGIRGEVAYYDFCFEYNIDEPHRPTVLTSKTLNQVAGLQVFVEKYEQLLDQPSAHHGREA